MKPGTFFTKKTNKYSASGTLDHGNLRNLGFPNLVTSVGPCDMYRILAEEGPKAESLFSGDLVSERLAEHLTCRISSGPWRP